MTHVESEAKKLYRMRQYRELICSLDTVNDRVAPMFGFITQLYLICCNYHTFSFEKQAYKEKFKRPNFRSEREQCTVGNV